MNELSINLVTNDVVAFERRAVALAQVLEKHGIKLEAPVTHRFTPGIYLREIIMPAGAIVVGHKHNTEHFNIVLSGRATVIMNGEREEIHAGQTIISKPGVRKVLLIHEDMRWQTVHSNPENVQEIEALEDAMIDKASALVYYEHEFQLLEPMFSQPQLKEAA